MGANMTDQKNLSAVERIKQGSDALRGTLAEGLQGELSGAVSDDDQSLVKFHGMYQQDDRDRREELHGRDQDHHPPDHPAARYPQKPGQTGDLSFQRSSPRLHRRLRRRQS